MNRHRIAHPHGAVCAIAPSSEGRDPAIGRPDVAVNVRCLPARAAGRWMRRVGTAGLGVVLVLAATACSRSPEMAADAGGDAAMERMPAAPAPAMKALAAPAGTFLAYETSVQVRLPGGEIGKRLQAVQEACQQARFGDCAVLSVVEQGGGEVSGSIEVRTAPAGVEPLLKLAGEGGDIAARTTQAEDLAQQVADTRMTQDRLEAEHARLLEFQRRSDLKVADLLAISQRLAEIESQAEAAKRDAAQQRRRIDTQKLSIGFEASGGERGRSEIGQALAESGRIFAGSIATLVRLAAGLLPVAIVLGLLLGLGRWWWRRRR